jgi:hypothetical protein
MKKNILFILALFLLLLFTASVLQAGYRANPWGSKTWTGPGRPPHWSPKPAKPVKSPKVYGSKKYGVYDRKVRHPRDSYTKGGYWKDRHNRWHHHSNRRAGYMYYRAPNTEKLIVERERPVPVYIPVQRRPSRLQCGGSTITRSDLRTGEMYIEYVTSARDC